MKNSQHLNKSLLTGFQGVNQDITPDMHSTLKGKVFSMVNGRVDKTRQGDVLPIGNDKQLRTFLEVTYPPGGGKVFTSGECVWAGYCGSYRISLWNTMARGVAPESPSYAYGVIIVDDKIVLMSVDVAFVGDKLSVDVNPGDVKEIYITDGTNPPMVLDVADMVYEATAATHSLHTDKYFVNFDPKDYGPSFSSDLGRVTFIKLQEVGTGAGVKCGVNIYLMRLVDFDGNRTGWSVSSPTIPVVMNDDITYEVVSAGTPAQFGFKTYGGNAGDTSKYGVRVRFRVNNRARFSYVEMGKLSYVSGGPMGDIATFGIAPVLTDADGKSVSLDNIDTQVIDFLDTSDVVWETSSEVLSNQLSVIKSADALRYFADYLVYFGITYEDLDLSADFTLKTSSTFGSGTMIPHVRMLDRIGHRSVYNQALYRSNMHNESREYGIVFHDGKGGTTPAIPLTDVGTFRFPCQREAMTMVTRDYSKYIDASEANSVLTDNHLVCARINNVIGWGYSPWTDYDDMAKEDGGQASPFDTVYSPYHPVNRQDDRVDSMKYNYNFTRVIETDGGVSNPYLRDRLGYYPRFLSLGAALSGVNISALPKWVKGFSIVQTESDNYVVAQGIAMYDIKNIYDTTITTNTIEKNVDGFILHFPDLDARIGIDPSIVEDMKRNPNSYSIQLVAPVGFFTDPYRSVDEDWVSIIGSSADIDKDMMVNATVMRAIHPNLTDDYALVGDGSSGHVIFGKYRSVTITNPLASDIAGAAADPKNAFCYPLVSVEDLKVNKSISGVIRELNTSRTTMLKVSIDKNVYSTASGTNSTSAGDATVRNFHEPFYIVNLVRVGAAVTQGNVQRYKTINQYQRLVSEIGVGNGGELVAPLADERVHDYLYVNGRCWYLSRNIAANDAAAQAILQELRDNDQATVAGYDDTVYGVARYNMNGGEKEIIFTNAWVTGYDAYYDPYYLYPNEGEVIEMRYNSNTPIELMGGDHIISEAYCAPLDLSYGTTTRSTSKNWGSKTINTGFPYRYLWEPAISGGASSVSRDFSTDIRQMVLKSYLLTKVNIPLITNDAYPNRGYMLKPSSHAFVRDVSGLDAITCWKKLDYDAMLEALGDFNYSIYGDSYDYRYLTDYADQMPYINYGGFVLPQMVNSDYSKQYQHKHVSLPQVGFTPVTYFPNRVHHSQRRNPSVQDAPNIKTFLASAVWDMDSKQGKISRAFDTRVEGSGGYDLFVFTERGICRLLTNRQMISTADGNTLGILPPEGSFIQAEDWINKTVGIPTTLTRLATEHLEQLFFVSTMDVYQFGSKGLEPISEGFKKTLLPWISGMLSSVTVKDMGGTGHRTYDEILFLYDGVVYAYNYAIKSWMGTRVYTGIDKMVGDNDLGGLYGFNYATYLREYTLDTNLANPTTYKDFSVEMIAADDPKTDKEFVMIYLVGDIRPDSIEFRTDIDGAAESIVSIAYPTAANNLYMKHYGKGWWTYVPRALAGSHYREQGNYLVTKVKHNTQTSGFEIKFVEIGWKPIK